MFRFVIKTFDRMMNRQLYCYEVKTDLHQIWDVINKKKNWNVGKIEYYKEYKYLVFSCKQKISDFFFACREKNMI